MMGAIVFALMSACSNDEPNIPDDNDNPNPGNTEEPSELLPRWEKSSLSLCREQIMISWTYGW